PPPVCLVWGWLDWEVVFGGVLLSHDLAVAVPSALRGLASGFGMGPGVSRLAMTAVTLWRCALPAPFGSVPPIVVWGGGGGGVPVSREPHSGRVAGFCFFVTPTTSSGDGVWLSLRRISTGQL